MNSIVYKNSNQIHEVYYFKLPKLSIIYIILMILYLPALELFSLLFLHILTDKHTFLL